LKPIRQAAPPHRHRTPRRLHIQYDLPTGVDATHGSPGTVLIPIQVENSSKKRKVRHRLAASGPAGTDYTRDLSRESVSEPREVPNSESGELPDAESIELPATSSESGELLDAPPAPQGSIPYKSSPELPVNHFKLLTLNDKMAENTLDQGAISPTG